MVSAWKQKWKCTAFHFSVSTSTYNVPYFCSLTIHLLYSQYTVSLQRLKQGKGMLISNKTLLRASKPHERPLAPRNWSELCSGCTPQKMHWLWFLLYPQRITLLPNGTLKIANVTRRDGGSYTCIAKNQFGTASALGRLLITGKITTAGNTTLSQTCKYNGQGLKW